MTTPALFKSTPRSLWYFVTAIGFTTLMAISESSNLAAQAIQSLSEHDSLSLSYILFNKSCNAFIPIRAGIILALFLSIIAYVESPHINSIKHSTKDRTYELSNLLTKYIIYLTPLVFFSSYAVMHISGYFHIVNHTTNINFDYSGVLFSAIKVIVLSSALALSFRWFSRVIATTNTKLKKLLLLILIFGFNNILLIGSDILISKISS